jgi:hypothetical protein
VLRPLLPGVRGVLLVALLACGGGGGSGGFRVVVSDPPDGATAVALGTAVRFRFNLPVDPGSVGPGSVALAHDGNPIAGTCEILEGGLELRFLPDEALPSGANLLVTLDSALSAASGPGLGGAVTIEFTTVADGVPPQAFLAPAPGTGGIAPGSRIVAVFSEPIDPASVGSATLQVLGPTGPVIGTLALEKGNRVLAFAPSSPLPAGATLTAQLLGGPSGPRDLAGNLLPQGVSTSFGVGAEPDFEAPTATITVNEFTPVWLAGIHLPPAGFTIDVAFSDGRAVDPGSLRVDASVPLGPALLPAAAAGEDLFPLFSVDPGSAQARIPDAFAMATGVVTIVATVRDLAGNESPPATLDLLVAPFPDALRPFEAAQEVFVDFSVDRAPMAGGNGVPDFEEDLLELGLSAAGDPIGSNATMRARCEAAIMETAAAKLEAGPRLRIRLDTSPPTAGPFTSICVGGIDPAWPGRSLGDPSTGVLGRSWFDLHNENPAEDDCSTNPPLGVFPGELFLALGSAAIQAGGATLFGQTYSPLSPAFGGTPAGEHPLDLTVLAPGFSLAGATAAEQERFLEVALGIERLGASMGTILAHELGHAFGLVPPGTPPEGLFGNVTMHNASPSALDVMPPAFTYENLVLLPLRFRPTNIAYLRERVVVACDLVEGTTLAELSRRASAIVLASPTAASAGGHALVRVEESFRGAVPGSVLEISALPPSAPLPGSLLLLYLAETPRGLVVLGGERGAIPIDLFADAPLLHHARGLVALADPSDERLLVHLADDLASPSARVREDAAAEIARMPAHLSRSLEGEALWRALTDEEGPSMMRVLVLAVLAARGLEADAPILVREVLEGPPDSVPLAGQAASAVPGATQRLVASLGSAPEDGRVRLASALGFSRDPIATRTLESLVLGDPSPRVRLEALAALARPGGAVDGSALFHVLATGGSTEKTLAATVLLLRGSESDRQALRGADSAWLRPPFRVH